MCDSKKYAGFIYCITNKINGKKYVGQTRTSVNIRWTAHKSDARLNKNDGQYLHSAMRQYGIDNFTISEVTSVLCDSISELCNTLNQLEQRYIVELNTLVPCGYNITPGGQMFSESVSRGIYDISESGVIVSHYKSIREAMMDTGVNEKTIHHACNLSKSHYGGGHFWYYDTDIQGNIGDNIGGQARGVNNWKGHNTYRGKPVGRYSKDGILIDTFESAKCASIQLHISQAHISKCCTGTRKTAGGYQWSFI